MQITQSVFTYPDKIFVVVVGRNNVVNTIRMHAHYEHRGNNSLFYVNKAERIIHVSSFSRPSWYYRLNIMGITCREISD